MLLRNKQLDLAPRALQRLNIKTQPFHTPTECGQLFHSTALDMLSNSIIQQLKNPQQIQLVYGENNIGKSCFCRRLFCEAPTELQLTFYKAKKQSRINNIFLAILGKQAKKPGQRTHALATSAAKHIFHTMREQQKPALVIDDAHLLSPSVLRMLLRFRQAIEKQERGALKLILVAEKTLEGKLAQLADAAPSDENLQISLLRPLSRIEIADYIEFRLKSAGAQNSPMGVKTLSEIHQLSGGLPGKIDQLVCEVLNHGRITSNLNRRFSVNVASLGLVGLTIFAMSTYYLLVAGNHEAPFATPSPISHSTTEPAATDKQTGHAPQTERNQAALAATEQADNHSTPQAPAQTSVDSQHLSNTDQQTLSSEDWLKQWPDQHYVIQLLGSWEQDKLQAAAQSYTLDKQLIVIKSLRHEKPWYALLYGPFIDADQANQAIRRLPQDLQNKRPWPRRIDSIINH